MSRTVTTVADQTKNSKYASVKTDRSGIIQLIYVCNQCFREQICLSYQIHFIQTQLILNFVSNHHIVTVIVAKVRQAGAEETLQLYSTERFKQYAKG